MSSGPNASGSSSPDGETSHQIASDSYLAESMLNSSRARSGTTEATPRREGELDGNLPTRRRASDAYDQLADSFYRPVTTPLSTTRRNPPHSQQTLYNAHALSQNSPLHSAARFRNRNLSDSSIDSQGGAYIDHRRHGSFLPSSAARIVSNSSGGARRSMQTVERVEDRVGGVEIKDEEESRSRRASDSSSAGPGRRTRSVSPLGEQASHSQISDGTLRQRLTSADLEEHAIEDEDERLMPQDALSRHASSRFRNHISPIQHRRNSYNMEDSRAGSPHGKPEEDVCFPVHCADPIDSLHPEEVHHHHHHNGGVAGVLHNFPFPFDFGALEEFAENERESVPNLRRNPSSGIGGPGGMGSSPPGYSTQMNGRKVDPVRQRKLSESVAPGRIRQTLFDPNAHGEDELVGDALRNRAAQHASILDVKTPLLPANLPIKPTNYGATGGSASARPYRFSFYSNALPSTIHARSLAEIPAEGQTFEELFVGHQQDTEDEGGWAESGINTPAGRASVNGARPGGIAQPQPFMNKNGLGSGGGGGGNGRIRTEVDAESNSWWLDVLCPTDQEMKILSKVFGIHPLTTEDILMEETREKIELFRNYYFVCFRSFEQDPYSPTYLEPLNMYIIVFREGTLSFHFRGTPHPQNVRRRIKQLKDYINVTSDWISYALIDDITDAFGPLIQNIEYEVDSIDELVLILKEAEQSDMLRRIGTCRKKVMGLLRLMGNKADVVKGLSKRCNENWSVAPKSDIGLYLSDIQDHITTSTQNLTHYEKILSRSHSNYLAQISIEMTDANNEINNVLSKLTALGTILIPLNLVTGLWGMNVHVPGQDVTEGYTWFFSIIGALAAIGLSGAYASYTLLANRS